MNKYRVAETIVTKILEDLKQRMSTSDKWDVADEEISKEVADKWEDIIISELQRELR